MPIWQDYTPDLLSYAHLDRRAIHATTNALDFCAVKDVISMGGSAAMSPIPGMLASPRMSKVRPARPPSSGFARHLHLQRRCKCHDQRVVTLSHDGLREHTRDGRLALLRLAQDQRVVTDGQRRERHRNGLAALDGRPDTCTCAALGASAGVCTLPGSFAVDGTGTER